MSISNSQFGLDIDAQQEYADGISFAEDNGADVINNSWSMGWITSTWIDAAVESAIANGRGGLGCVVVFSTGNFDTDVMYPANSNPDVISVGAISPCGEKTSSTSCDTENNWGSCWGQEVDLAAPGVLIPTLDRLGSINGYNPNTLIHPGNGGTLVSSDYPDYDYTTWFSGTSAAAPHVSGVAALILSANNGLTHSEVADIMESTAQKVGGYTYHTQLDRDNGLWHQYVGYGLVDAGASVQSAVCDHTIENTTYTSDITISDCTSVEMEDISVQDDAILTIENVGSISIDGPFEAEVGTQLVFNL